MIQFKGINWRFYQQNLKSDTGYGKSDYLMVDIN